MLEFAARDCGWSGDDFTGYCAVSKGHLDCLKFLQDNGLILDLTLARIAAGVGHLDCLKYVCENCPEVQKDHNICHLAAGAGKLDCLEYAIQFGIVFRSEEASFYVIEQGQVGILKYFLANRFKIPRVAIAFAARCNQMEILTLLVEHNFEYDETAIYEAANHGSLDVLKYFHKLGYKFDTQYAVICAATNGHLNCLAYLHENGCGWDSLVCMKAAKNGHINCLKYAHENGCPWDETTCTRAAESECLTCLQYAHENGCPWSEELCVNSILKCFNFELLKYAIENGCPWSIRSVWTSVRCGKLHILQYLLEKGAQSLVDEYKNRLDRNEEDEEVLRSYDVMVAELKKLVLFI